MPWVAGLSAAKEKNAKVAVFDISVPKLAPRRLHRRY
jgi:hypothetical protein